MSDNYPLLRFLLMCWNILICWHISKLGDKGNLWNGISFYMHFVFFKSNVTSCKLRNWSICSSLKLIWYIKFLLKQSEVSKGHSHGCNKAIVAPILQAFWGHLFRRGQPVFLFSFICSVELQWVTYREGSLFSSAPQNKMWHEIL